METYAKVDLYKYASDEAMRGGGDDPRLAAQAAEQAYRRSHFGHVEAVVKATRVAQSVPMQAGQEYAPAK